MITIDDVKKAEQNLKGIVYDTPLKYCASLSNENFKAFLKFENLQKTGSFKLRGAYNKIASLSPQERSNGVIASSAGNHAQGVAFSAKAFAIPAVICMPVTAPLAKINNTRSYGAEVVLYGNVYDDAFSKACEIQQQRGLTFVHPFDDDDVMAGQGTIALEILAQAPNLDAIITPIGGGGLISGIAIAAKAINPHIKIIGVEASQAACMKQSLTIGEVCMLDSAITIADGIAVKKPGSKPFEVVKNYVDAIITVEEEEIAAAILLLLEKAQVMAEGAGAVAVAAALSGKLPKELNSAALIVSGGNIDINMVARIINRGLITTGRRFTFTTDITDKVGQIHDLAHILNELKANIFSINLTSVNRDVAIGHQSVDVTLETYGETHKQEIIETLTEIGYILRY